MKETKRVTWAEEIEEMEEINNSERKKENKVLCFICEEKEAEEKEWGEFCEEYGKMLMEEDEKLKWEENQGQKNIPEKEQQIEKGECMNCLKIIEDGKEIFCKECE